MPLLQQRAHRIWQADIIAWVIHHCCLFLPRQPAGYLLEVVFRPLPDWFLCLTTNVCGVFSNRVLSLNDGGQPWALTRLALFCGPLGPPWLITHRKVYQHLTLMFSFINACLLGTASPAQVGGSLCKILSKIIFLNLCFLIMCLDEGFSNPFTFG